MTSSSLGLSRLKASATAIPNPLSGMGASGKKNSFMRSN
jgi:hypothetical protein